MDRGFVPIFFFRPPQGAMLGPALLMKTIMKPCSPTIRVCYLQVPKWFELRTATALTP